MELLRERSSTRLFNAALRAVPENHLPALLELLQPQAQDQQPSSSSRRSSSSSRRRRGDGGGDGGGGGEGGGLRPNHDTAAALLDRALRAPRLREDVNAWMQRLLEAGLEPSYRVFLPWASLHARFGSVAGVRHVMAAVQAAGWPLAPQYYTQLVRVSLGACSARLAGWRAGTGRQAALLGWAQGVCLPRR